MRQSVFIFSLGLLFSGCFETNFNFQTVVHRDGSMDREAQIEGRSADRFLPPAGPEWNVKTFETKGGQSILEDTRYHIHAKGRFAHVEDFTSDFQYDTPRLVANLTDETREELVRDVGIPEPLDDEIGAANYVELTRERSLWRTTYAYKEVFEVRRLIPILLHDLQKEIRRKQQGFLKRPSHAIRDVPGETSPEAQGRVALTEAEVEELAWRQLTGEILPALQFHSEVTLPGNVLSTNATRVHGHTAIWDFSGADFNDHFRVYELRVTSRSSNVGLVVAALVLVVAVTSALVLRQRRGARKKRRVES